MTLFVWERSMHGVCKAAIYQEEPPVMMDSNAEQGRFAFKHKLNPDEEYLLLEHLILKYPCPELSTHEPRLKPNLTRNQLP